MSSNLLFSTKLFFEKSKLILSFFAIVLFSIAFCGKANAQVAVNITSDLNNVCNGTEVTLTANPSGGTSPYTYLWDNAAETTGAIIVAPGTTTTYKVVVTDADDNVDSATITITVKQPTFSSFSTAACTSYTWRGTTYSTSGAKNFDTLNVAGCDSIITLNLTITSAPVAGSISGTTDICSNGTTTLSTTGTGGSWSSVSTGVATINGSGVVTAISAGTTTIRYIVTGTGGCSNDTASTVVTVTAVPVAGSISGTTGICSNGTTTLSTTGTGGTWSSVSTGVATIDASGEVTAVSAGTSIIRYVVEGTGGCANDTASTTVTVTAAPVAGSISGTTEICSNGTTTLSTTGTGGTWSSVSTGVATIDGSGVVTPVSAGTTTIRYIVTGTGGCSNDTASTVVTVTAVPVAGSITGTTGICSNGTTTLSTTGTGGTWSSVSTGVATIDASGEVTAVSAGTSIIRYVVEGTGGCANDTASTTVTVTAAPVAGSISGTTDICSNGTTTLSTTGTGGTWSSVSTGIATINGSGEVTAVSAGTTTIRYIVTGTGGCSNDTASTIVTVTAAPVAGSISGTTGICSNGTTTLSTTGTGGTWSSVSTGVATIDASGEVTAVSAGTSIIRYVVEGTGGCANDTASTTVTVTAAPVAGSISGTTEICSNGTTTLSTSGTGGTWSSVSTGVATIDGSGVVTPVSAGTTTIRYIVTGTGGCSNDTASTIVTVTAAPVAGSISGTTGICSNGTTTLSTTGTGGTWSSVSTGVATIDASGEVTAVSAGTSIIRYVVEGLGGCANDTASTTVTVTAAPVAGSISGTTDICSNGTTTLSTTGTGGTWSSVSTGVATIDASGEVTPVSAGTTTIRYIVTGTGGCSNDTASTIVTVTAVPVAGSISGTTGICSNGTTTLSTTGTGGTWSSVSTGVATIDASGEVTAVSAGTSIIRYVVEGLGGCANDTASTTVTVTAAPVAGSISGTTDICSNGTTTLSTTGTGGTWSSVSTGVATIDGSGVVTPVSAGTTTIRYIVTGTGGCSNDTASTIVTVTAAPVAGSISGTTGICSNGTTTLSTTGTGGTWSSVSTGVATIDASGEVTPVSAGTSIIRYVLEGTGGCANDTASTTVTVTAAPDAGDISGTTEICSNGTTTLSTTGTGGSWSSASTGVATINGSGVVTAVSAGTTTIRYIVIGTGGCANDTASTTVTVTAAPSAGTLGGTEAICSTGSTTFTSSVSGGTWTSDDEAVATIDGSTGAITVVSAGSATMTYVVTGTGGCANDTATRTVTITTAPDAGDISGTTGICSNGTTTLSTTGTGGTWSSVSTGVATIDASGEVTPVSAGATTIRYIVTGTGGCSNDTASTVVTVTAAPSAGTLSGTQAICSTGSTTFTSSVSGGTWTSDDEAVATIDGSTGAITVVSAGSATMTYVVEGTGGCANDTASTTVTVTAAPDAGDISGTTGICSNGTTTLSTSGTGGTWSSVSTGVATINGSGVVTAVSAGTTTIRYIVTGTGGCANDTASTTVTVTAAPSAGTLSGTQAICSTGSTTFTSTVSGGTWTSGDEAVATIDGSTGVITVVAAGSSIMTYTVEGTGGCSDATDTRTVTITTAPDAGDISGTTGICSNGTTTLSTTGTGGTWSSVSTGVATIDASGEVTPVSAGTTTIRYIVTGTGGCSNDTASTVVTVTAAPSAGTISGSDSICVSGTTTFSTSGDAGGNWFSDNETVATVNISTGLVTAISAGTATITYKIIGSGGCIDVETPKDIVVSALPDAGSISGTTEICSNGTTTLSTTGTGGSWSSVSTGVATIDGSGVVTPVSAGTTTIRYIVTGTGGCTNDTASTVVTVTAAPSAGTLSGTQAICSTGSTTFTSTVSGGTWTSDDEAVATIDGSTGVITVVSAGSSIMTYTVEGTGGCSDATDTRTVTITTAPDAGDISGTTGICSNGTTTLSTTGTGGTWSSVSTGVATIDASGEVTPVSAGTTTIRYIVIGTGGCSNDTASTVVTVTAAPSAGTLGGTEAICSTGSTTFTSTVSGGAWTSDDEAVATIDGSTGVITVVSAGSSIMTYTVEGTGGCSDATDTRTVTITTAPDAGDISGTTGICSNGTTTLSTTGTGGTWSSVSTGVATIDGSGVVTAVSAGTTTIRYIVTGTGGCSNDTASTVVTVTAAPSAGTLSGTQAICSTGSTTFTSSVSGGTWTSDDEAVATIDGSTGVITVVAAGSSIMTYTVEGTGGCSDATDTRTVTITTAPDAGSISGTTEICSNGTTTLSTTGTGGTWSSVSTGVATIDASGEVTPVSAGTSLIRYVVEGTGGCANDTASTTVTVTAAPSAGTLGGTEAICSTGSTTFTSTVSGGTWTSGDETVATIDGSTGVITVVAAGSSIMTYTVEGTGGCSDATDTRTVTITTAPDAGSISGTTEICSNGTTTLSTTGTGGTWSSVSTGVATIDASGEVTPVSAGTSLIRYVVEGTGGCANDTASTTVTVTAAPSAGTLGGTEAICSTGSTTFTSTVSGGTWTSGDEAVATIDGSTGVITVVAAGSSIMTYTVEGTGGCSDATDTRTVTITTAPDAGSISGTTEICSNGTTTLSTTGTGGTWSSVSTGVATIDASGEVTPVSAGTSLIRYVVEGTGGCANDTASTTVTVTAAPSAGTLGGTEAICSTGSTTFTSTVSGGTWTSGDEAVATIDGSTGVITVVAAGSSIMTYTVEGTGGCSDATDTRTVTITTAPVAGDLSGTQEICSNETTTFSSTEAGGDWSSVNTSIADVDGGGVISPVSAGITEIRYIITGTGGCANDTSSLSITIKSTSTFDTTVLACTSFTWHATEYTSSGDYTFSTSNFVGCDSVETLHLTINSVPPSALDTIFGNVELCQYVNTSDTLLYHVTPVSGATFYHWNVNNNVGVTYFSGEGNDSIYVVFNSALQASGARIYVSALSAAGCESDYTFIRLSKTIPVVSTITGSRDACPVVGLDTTITYTCNQPANATSYLWVAPTGATIEGRTDSNVVSVKFDNSFTSGLLKVTALSNCGSRSTPSSVIISKLPVTTPTTLSGPTNACSYYNYRNTATYTVGNVPNATSYYWTLPDSMILVSGQGTNTIVVNFDSGFVTSLLKVKAINNCSVSADKAITITATAFAIPSTITGPANPCPYINVDEEVSYSIPKVTGALGYIWTVPAGISIVDHPEGYGENDTVITVTMNSALNATDTIKVQSTGCNNSAAKTFILKKSVPVSATTIFGSTKVCSKYTDALSLSDTVIYRINKIPNASTYTWTLPRYATAISGAIATVDTFVVVKFTKDFTSGILSVRANSYCGNSGLKSISITKSVAATPGGIQRSFTPNVLAIVNVASIVKDTIQIRKVANATGYAWTLNSGTYANIVSLNASGLPENDTIVVVNILSGFSKDTVSVKSLVSNCSISSARTLALSALFAPAGIASITGSLIPCSGETVSYTATFATPTSTQANANRVRWTIPNNTEIVSSNSDSTVVGISCLPGFSGGSISARGVSLFGAISATSTSITLKYASATPTNITSRTGNFAPCVGDTVSYYVIMPVLTSTQSPAVKYRWTKPANTTIVNAEADSSRIRLRFDDSFTGGIISVKGETNCGVLGALKSIAFTAPKLSPIPTNIISRTGNLYAGCNSDTISYTALPGTASTSQEATASYKWVLPVGVTIVSATSDSVQVKLQFGSTFVGGNLQVKGVTACGGVGSAKVVTLIRYLTPTPTNITSSTSSYNACIGNTISYTVVVPAPNATQQIADVYRWTLPANTQIQSANTDSSIVSVTFNSGYTGGSLIVKGQTNCGVVGTQKSVSLTRTGCPSGLFAKNTTEINPTSKAKINIFPNPNNGNFKIALKIGRPTNEKVNIQMINTFGKIIFSNDLISVNGDVNLNINNKFAPGIYLIKFKTAHEESVEKIIIQ